LYIIKIEPENEQGLHLIQSQSHRMECWLEGYVEIPPELVELAIASGGYCDLTLLDGQLLELHPIEIPGQSPLEIGKAQKLEEISAICKATIHAGFTATLSDGVERHFSFDAEDQGNIAAAVAIVKDGKPGFPYHSDKKRCAFYSAEDIIALGDAGTAHKIIHSTYANYLNDWIRQTEDAAELEGIYYGAQLPEDLQKEMEEVLRCAGLM